METQSQTLTSRNAPVLREGHRPGWAHSHILPLHISGTSSELGKPVDTCPQVRCSGRGGRVGELQAKVPG